jgi:prephenate dehydrogenase
MAGREVSGPTAARSDLFEGRPWVVCPPAQAAPGAVALVDGLVRACGALPVRMSAADHDAAVALVSHAPHLLASLVAGRLAAAPEAHVALAGPGVADVTRVAAGDPALWRDILASNAAAVGDVLRAVQADLAVVLDALDRRAGGEGLETLLQAGAAGRARLPGKHGGRRTEFRPVPVVIDDRPGQLGRLFGDIGAAGANIEDVRIEHSPGQPVGLVEVSVRPEAADRLVARLRAGGWTVHD